MFGKANSQTFCELLFLSLANLRFISVVMGEDYDTQGNSRCFVYRLPTETLGTIFIHCACEYHSTASGHPIPTAPSWVNVSYVSRRWRDVALNCPTLWTYLFITSSRWTEELLARSNRAPLKLQMRLSSQNSGDRASRFFHHVMGHLERIQQFRLLLSPTCYNYQFLSKLFSRAPCLQNLEIVVVTLPMFAQGSLPFYGDTPALRTLKLTSCPLPWYSFKLSSLTTLVLSNIPAQFQQSTVEFLSTLSCMQALTHLHLKGALASTTGFLSSSAFRTFQKVNLPHLSCLLIADLLSTVIALLSCVNIPLKTEIRLHCGAQNNFCFVDDYAPLFSFIAQRFTLSKDWTSKSRSVLERDCDAFMSTIDMEWGSNIPLQIILRNHLMSRSDRERAMSYTCCPVPFPNIESIHVHRPPHSSAFWMHVLGRLQGLRYLKLSDGNMPPPLASLLSLAAHDGTESDTEHPDQGGNQTFAPALEELEFQKIVFSTTRKGADVQSLLDALSTRNDACIQLAMSRCIECQPEIKMFDVSGWCEDGCFRVVEESGWTSSHDKATVLN
ncbi:hypothetical protein EV363DRAFT_1461222 [Boletus edulis]|nr:hypothetical protein EV363DRAFT_1461222 [Boletus edulis]